MRREFPLEYIAGYFDGKGTIFFTRREAGWPQPKVQISEPNSSVILVQIHKQLGLGNLYAATTANRTRLQIGKREEVHKFACLIEEHVVLKRELVSKTIDIMLHMDDLAKLRARREPKTFDRLLERDIEVGMLELYDLISEHDTIRMEVNGGSGH